jgi:hypothetical protein
VFLARSKSTAFSELAFCGTTDADWYWAANAMFDLLLFVIFKG